MSDDTELLDDPEVFLDEILTPGVERHRDEVAGLDLDAGYDAWLEGVVDIAENDIMDQLETDFAEADVDGAEVEYHLDHTSGLWTAELTDDKGSSVGFSEEQLFEEPLKKAFERLRAQRDQ